MILWAFFLFSRQVVFVTDFIQAERATGLDVNLNGHLYRENEIEGSKGSRCLKSDLPTVRRIDS